jgi:hypothetical protein
VRFAVIGDYGGYNASQTAIANLINNWAPDFIVTTGDNNYPLGEASTIDKNIGQNFHQYIGNYRGSYGDGSQENRFFPVLGNHDWSSANAQPYLDYFTLPGNERYYTFKWGMIEFFMLDSDSHEPDGVGESSVQAQWLRTALAGSTADWKIVVLHHAPYTSGGNHGPTVWAQWPYEEWGADAVLAGHEHVYERLQIGDIPFFVNGLGGYAIYDFGATLPESKARYNEKFGAMLVEATGDQIEYQFISVDGELIDSSTVNH